MDYKYKYHKYKQRYIRLKTKMGGAQVAPDHVEPEEEFVKSVDTTGEFETPYSQFIERAELPPDQPDPSREEYTPELKPEYRPSPETDYFRTPFDLGTYGLSRAVARSTTDYTSDDYTSLDKPSVNKILMIADVDTFDNFTQKYGFLRNSTVHIKWNIVEQNFKGLYVNPSLIGERSKSVYFKDGTYTSWWTEYLDRSANIIEAPIEFVKPYLEFPKGKSVDRPFSARTYSEVDIADNQYISIEDTPDKNKILKLDDTQSFDRFTNRFGNLEGNRVKINWSKFLKAYKGIYIDKDKGIDLQIQRFRTAFYKGDKVKSWWKRSGLKRGVIYLYQKK